MNENHNNKIFMQGSPSELHNSVHRGVVFRPQIPAVCGCKFPKEMRTIQNITTLKQNSRSAANESAQTGFEKQVENGYVFLLCLKKAPLKMPKEMIP